MIEILSKENCVGCSGCRQICPKHCISMTEDEQGFPYPKVDAALCVDCGLCEKVCPVINQASPRKPAIVYAGKNPDEEVLMRSSSGGVFFALAKSVIERGGVVFGARFDNKWEVIHDYAETLADLEAFQGSKYVQSRIDESFKIAEKFLKEGRTVMFTGTPCQIAGLNLFLRKPYDNLLAVDVVCHGVPSPLVWREYLKYIIRPKGVGKNTDFRSTLKDGMPVITGISFRDKRLGWEKFGFSVHAVARQGDSNSDFQSTINTGEEQELLFEPLDKNLYMQIFLKDLDLRPSCYACPAKCGKAHSDITIADYWGIKSRIPAAYDSNGVSLVFSNTEKGGSAIQAIPVELTSSSYETALMGNPSIEKSVVKPRMYAMFWEHFLRDGFISMPQILAKMRPLFIHRILGRFKGIVRRLLGIIG